MPWKRFSCRSAGSADFNLAKITFHGRRTSTPARTLFINGGGDPNFGGTCNFCHTNAGALAAHLPEPEPQLQHQRRRRGASRAQRPELSERRRLRANEPIRTAPSATARSTRHPWWKRQTPRRSFTTTSWPRSKTSWSSTPDPNSTTRERTAARFNFNQTQIDQIADFMRGVNTLQNIDVARRELQEILAQQSNPRREQDTRLQTAFEETQDAIDVLTEGGIFPAAVTASHLGART